MVTRSSQNALTKLAVAPAPVFVPRRKRVDPRLRRKVSGQKALSGPVGVIDLTTAGFARAENTFETRAHIEPRNLGS